MNWKRILSIFVSVLCTSILYAKPPDKVCDPLKDATPGLYGLCVSFCIAQPPGDLGALELSKSQQKILEAYNKKRTFDDPNMPCFQGCPCFSIKEAEFVATHPYFYNCADFSNEEVNNTPYERLQSIDLWGDINEGGYGQTRGNVSAHEPEPDENHPPWVVTCEWSYHEESPFLDIGRFWEGDYFNKEDQRKIEDCQAIIGYVAEEYELPCETEPGCEQRIVIDSFIRDDRSYEVDGFLINEPNDICVNNASIARVEWYWGDGTMKTFELMPDGYVYPFPSSHTYPDSQVIGYLISIYAYDEDGEIIAITSRLAFLW